MFEKVSEVLASLCVDGAVLGSATVEVTLKRGSVSVAHLDIRVEADGSCRITSALVDEQFHPAIKETLEMHKPDYVQVSDFSVTGRGLWDFD